MKKVIRISNEPIFGILYVRILNIDKYEKGINNGYYVIPDKKDAKDFKEKDCEYIKKAIDFIKKSFPKATVETIYIK